MDKTKVHAWSIIGIGLGLTALTLLVPTPPDMTWFSFHVYLGLATLVASVDVGASLLFVRGLDKFTNRLRRAYISICIGFGLTGLALLQIPVLTWLGQFNKTWADTQIVGLPFVVALLALFWGTRSFARLFAIKNVSTTFWMPLVVAAVAAALFALVPHAPISIPESRYIGSNSFNILSITFLVFALSHLLQIKRVASVLYTNALAWTVLSLWFMSLSGLCFLVATALLGEDKTNYIAAFTLVPHAIAGILLVRGAYGFNQIGQGDMVPSTAARDFFGKPKMYHEPADLSSVDIVVYAASLVSDRRAVDPLLEPLRVITSSLANANSTAPRDLTPEEQTQLMSIYLELERYLLEQEKIRKFTKDDLRQSVSLALHVRGDSQRTFWGRLPA